MRLDARINAARPDIADIVLADRLFASHYAQPVLRGCSSPSVPLRAEPTPDSAAVSELLLGEQFAVVDVTGDWAWGYCAHDHYVGYLPLTALAPATASNHVVASPAALLFSHGDIKAPLYGRLPMGARISGAAAGDFLETGSGFIHLRHVAPIDEHVADPVAVAERLIGAPYRWGGRSGDGVDCSGLVQLALGFAGTSAPRDSDQQEASLGAPIGDDAALSRGDLIFFPGHVGMMVDGKRMIHANAYWMAVTVEPLVDVVARLRPAHLQPITARRRIGG